jgi:uncharacterized protein DUF6949
MLDVLLLLYCGAVGFVAAGIAASFYKLVSGEPARFSLFGGTILGLATSFLFCALTGPVIVSGYAIRSRSTELGPAALLLVGIGIAALWSCCLGIVVLQLILPLRDGLA